MENLLTRDMSPEKRLLDDDALIRLGILAEWQQADAEALPDPTLVATCLDDTDEAVRRLAVAVLARFGEGAVPALTLALDQAQPPAIRIAGASALGSLGPLAAPAIVPLCGCLLAGDDLLRWHAGFALSRIGSEALPATLKMLASDSFLVVSSVLTTLEWMGTEDQGAIEEIEDLTHHPSIIVRLASFSALVKITEDPARGLPAMVSMLASVEDPDVRQSCLEKIGYLGPLAKDAQDAILTCFTDTASTIRTAAALTMVRVGATFNDIKSAWLDLLGDSDEEVRAIAAIAIGSYGPDAAVTISILETMAQEDGRKPAAAAAAALKAVRP